MNFIKSIKDHISLTEKLFIQEKNYQKVLNSFVKTIKSNGVIYWIGNGGSAADCEHFATELMVRFKKVRRPIKSISLTSNTSLLTAHSNDFDYKTIFSRQLEALATKNDLVVIFSTSGNSPNIIEALKFTKKNNINSCGFLGNNGGKAGKFLKNKIIIKSNNTARIQELHTLIGHLICEEIDKIY
jgi:D-sedoheptulose 7-phosphate isomerase